MCQNLQLVKKFFPEDAIPFEILTNSFTLFTNIRRIYNQTLHIKNYLERVYSYGAPHE